ncbi:MAG: RCC1 domain-containing protein [Solirubrobacteraceae bacterium]
MPAWPGGPPTPSPPPGLGIVGWGDNSYGQLGDGTKTSRWTPRAVSLFPVDVLSTSGPRALSISQRQAWAWGDNRMGELGIGSAQESLTPVCIPWAGQAISIFSGYIFSTAVTADGAVWSWGDHVSNPYVLGQGPNPPVSPGPVPLAGLTGFIAVDGGGYFGLALRGDGTVWAWGANDRGQLGQGVPGQSSGGWNPPEPHPVQIQGLDQVVAISGGSMHTLALKLDGSVWAWGGNYRGQLGQPGGDWGTPRPVPGLPGPANAVAGGCESSVALMPDGSVYAWGNPQGSTPVRVQGLPPAVAIEAGTVGANINAGTIVAAVTHDETVWTWEVGGSAPTQAPGVVGAHSAHVRDLRERRRIGPSARTGARGGRPALGGGIDPRSLRAVGGP